MLKCSRLILGVLMKYFTVQCPNCGSSIQSDSSHKLTMCSYCDTQVYTTVDHIFENISKIDGKRSSTILEEIRNAIKSNKHHTTSFKDSLLKASQEKIIKKEIQDYIESEIWNAKIVDTVLLNYKGKTRKFIVPFFIKKINNEAFVDASNLESIYIHNNVRHIEDNLFIEKFLNVTIYSDSLNSTASKYAALNKIPIEVINSKNRIIIFGGRFGELNKLITEISKLRLRQIKIIGNQYKTMWEQRKYLTDNSNLFTDYGGLDKIKGAETYDLKRFNLKFLDFLSKSFDKHGHINNFLFWNKEPDDLQKDIVILRKVIDDLRKERLLCDLFYDKYKFYYKNPPIINDYEIRKSQYKFRRFIDML